MHSDLKGQIMGKATKRKIVPLPISASDIERITQAIDRYSGDVRVLESAVGAYILGQAYGWRGLWVFHSHRTLCRYAEVLGFVDVRAFKAMFPESAQYTNTLNLIRLMNGFSDFWQVLAEKGDRVSRAMVRGAGGNG
jgi:hypothetical protein